MGRKGLGGEAVRDPSLPLVQLLWGGYLDGSSLTILGEKTGSLKGEKEKRESSLGTSPVCETYEKKGEHKNYTMKKEDSPWKNGKKQR